MKTKKKIFIVSIPVLFFLALVYGMWKEIHPFLHKSLGDNDIEVSAPRPGDNKENGDIENINNLDKDEEEIPKLYYHYKEGDHLRYKLKNRADIDVTIRIGSESEKTEAGIEISGILNFVVLKATGWDLLLSYRMDSPNVKISGDTPKTGKADTRIIEQALTEEILVSMNRYGRIEHLVFSKRVQPEIRNILKSLFAAIQVIFPSRPSMAWTQDEADLTGNYLAEYRVDSEGRAKKLKINKRKVRYDIVKPVAALDDQALQADISIGKSSTMIDFDKVDGYISDLEFNEGLKITIGEQATQKITSRIKIDLALIQKRKDDEYTKLGKAKWRDLIDTKVASLTAEGETMGLVSAEGEEAMKKRHFEQMLQGKSLQELFDTLHRLEVKEDGKLRYETLCQLEAFMNLYPQRIHEVTAMALQERAGSNGISTITTAMEQVPYPEAQEGLRSIIIQRSGEKDTLLLTIPSLGVVPNPMPESEALLWDLYKNWNDHDISTTSLLALGVMANTLIPLDNQRSAAIIDKLMTDFYQAKTTVEKIPYFEAFGNAGYPDIFDTVEAYTYSEDKLIRNNALSALRKIQTEEVSEIIAESLLEDPSEDVRYTAASIAESRPAGKMLFGALKQAYSNEENESIRAQILRSIWHNKNQFTEAMDIIRNARENDPSENIRGLATNLILISKDSGA